MKETILITGANSFIAQNLIPLVQEHYNLKYLTRTPKNKAEYAWDPANGILDEAALENVNYIIHLAGSKLNDGTPLTLERQKLVRDTRIGAAELLLAALKRKKQTIKAFVSASAMGYYGFTDTTLEIDEQGNKGTDFGAQLCEDWEKAADKFKTDNVANRVVKLRVSLVLGREGSLFKMLLNNIQAKLESYKSVNENSYFPWVHVADMAGMFAFAVENQKLEGVFNTTAPETTSRAVIYDQLYNLITNKSEEFEHLKTNLLLQHLTSKKIVQAGFQFKYPTINEALKNIM